MTVVLVISGNSVSCEQVKDILTNNSAEIDFSAPTPDSPQSQDMVSIERSELVIDKRRRRVFWEGQEVVLPRKQFDILFYLASHAGEVVTKSMLYQQVWKEEYDLNADEALKSQIKKLRQKLDAAGSCKIIETVWGVGYRLKE